MKRTALALLMLVGLMAPGCGPRAILFVDVLGDDTSVPPIRSLRVTLTSTRLGRSIVLNYPPVEDEIPLDNSFTANLSGDIENGDEILIDVVAVGDSDDLMQGAGSAILDLGDVTYAEVTLVVLGTCGDAVAGPGDECDGADLGGETCTSLGMGFTGGPLACTTGCLFDISGCTSTGPECGDAAVDAGEDCDGGDLGGETCETLGMGFTGGALGCAGDCTFDTGGCTMDAAPSIPVLRRPLNNSYTGFGADSRRPTFVWEASMAMAGPPIEYEIEYGTDGTFAGAATMNTMGFTNFQPTADLVVSTVAPVGARYYWHVRACAGTVCSDYSPTWWVNVGRSDRDFNGDGFSDIAVGVPGSDVMGTSAGRVEVYFGGAAPSLDTLPDGVIHGAADDELGTSLATGGDLNGDGFADLVVGVPGGDETGPDLGVAYETATRMSSSVPPSTAMPRLVLDGPTPTAGARRRR